MLPLGTLLHFQIVFIVVSGVACTNTGTINYKLGMEMMVRSYDAVCWFEALKKFPNTKVEMFNQCGGAAQFTLDNNGYVTDWSSEKMVKAFAEAFEQFPMAKIPNQYAGNCTKFLWTPFETAPALEGGLDVLNDGKLDYPYKAFSYCMMNQMSQLHGNYSIDAVMKERTHGKIEWHTTFLARQNEFRGHHKSNPFEMVQELGTMAQAWADKMASQCKVIPSLETERQWNGKTTGETLSSVWIGMLDEISTAAYAAAASWYEETKDYPWKEGFKDDNIKKIDWILFGKIKDFTQSVWGDSKMVGYGYAFNATCAEMGLDSRFMVTRYFPTGNVLGVKGQFKANVKPPGLLEVVVQAVPKLLGSLLG